MAVKKRYRRARPVAAYALELETVVHAFRSNDNLTIAQKHLGTVFQKQEYSDCAPAGTGYVKCLYITSLHAYLTAKRLPKETFTSLKLH